MTVELRDYVSLNVALPSLCLTSTHHDRMNFTHLGYSHLNVKGQFLSVQLQIGCFIIFTCLMHWLK